MNRRTHARPAAVLVSFAGLPGTGKSTVARALSARTGAVFLRIDEIEMAMRAQDPARELGPEGYHVAAALAASNLAIGHDAIVDCVNPWPITREIFKAAAWRGGARHFGVELRCSDGAEHRARVEGRAVDVPGLVPPDWAKVLARDYVGWQDADLRLDTARLGVEEAVARIVECL